MAIRRNVRRSQINIKLLPTKGHQNNKHINHAPPVITHWTNGRLTFNDPNNYLFATNLSVHDTIWDQTTTECAKETFAEDNEFIKFYWCDNIAEFFLIIMFRACNIHDRVLVTNFIKIFSTNRWHQSHIEDVLRKDLPLSIEVTTENGEPVQRIIGWANLLQNYRLISNYCIPVIERFLSLCHTTDSMSHST